VCALLRGNYNEKHKPEVKRRWDLAAEKKRHIRQAHHLPISSDLSAATRPHE